MPSLHILDEATLKFMAQKMDLGRDSGSKKITSGEHNTLFIQKNVSEIFRCTTLCLYRYINSLFYNRKKEK